MLTELMTPDSLTELTGEALETRKHRLHPDGSPAPSLNISYVYEEEHRHNLYLQQNILSHSAAEMLCPVFSHSVLPEVAFCFTTSVASA